MPPFVRHHAQKRRSRFQRTELSPRRPTPKGTVIMKRLAILPVLLAGIAGCGSVASPAYKGEPIASFHGYVLWEKKEPIVPVDLVMFWPDWSRTPVAGGTIVEIPLRVPLRADAPARFDFAVFEPAPEASYEPGSKEFWGARVSDATM